MTSAPLSGIRVVDLATERAELAGRFFADLGAEVIKVEPPAGARARTLPPFDHNNGESLYWASVALGKKSVILDIETESGQATLKRLASTADVLFESFDPGYMTSLGIGYDALRAINPRLVYVAVSPYGQDGPDAHSPATELTIEAAGGLISLQGDGDRPPIPVGYPQASFHGGSHAAADAIIALNERADSGLGQFLDTAMQPAIVWTLMNATGFPTMIGANPPATCEVRAAGPVDVFPGVKLGNVHECADGYVLAGVGVGDKGSHMLSKLVAHADVAGLLDEDLRAIPWYRWQMEMMEGTLDAATMTRALAAVTAYLKTKTKSELLEQAVEGDYMLAPFFTMAEVVEDPQLAAREYWKTIDGRTHPGVWALLSRTPIAITAGAPKLGQDQALLDSLPAEIAAPPVVHEVQRKGAFEGLRVADFAWVGVGPLIARAIADHGATVVHVESIARPDVLRMGPPFRDGIAGIDRSQFQANFNASKIGLALNLATQEGNDLAHKLIDWADVVLESYTPGTMKKLGLDYEMLSKTRPDLIMLSTCLRGQTGPHRSYAGFGTHGAVMGGLGVITGWPDRAPTGPWGAYTDFIAPRYGIAALSAAILERRSSGLGQYIDLSQIEAAAHFVEPLLLDYTVNGVVAGASGHNSLYAAPHGVYQTQGRERYVAISCETEAQWQALKAVAPLQAFSGPEFGSYAARFEARDAIDAAIRGWTAEKEPFAFAQELKNAGVPASVVLYPSDLYSDAQLEHRKFFKTLEHAEMGPTPYDGLVTRFSDAPAGPHSAAPCLGQHSDMVLRELLAVDDDTIVMAAAGGALT